MSKPAPPEPPQTANDPVLSPAAGITVATLAVTYVVVVLAADTLAVRGASAPLNWTVLHRNVEITILEMLFRHPPAPEWSQFDAFKFTAWFAVPLLLSLYRIDPGYFGVRRWKRMDVAILGVMILLGIGAVLLIPYVPGAKDLYRGIGEQSAEFKCSYARGNLLWTFSWLVGWEFLFRYFLLRNVARGFGHHAWWIVPLLEFVYHLQKPFAEALLAGGGGVLLTYWALKRQNMLLPFLAHLSIELALLVFMLVS